MWKLLALIGGIAWLTRKRPQAWVNVLPEAEMSDEYEEVKKRGYWCLACGRYIEATLTEDGRYVILHDKEPDHSYMTYDEEDHPQ